MQKGGKFLFRMEAKGSNTGFDFCGIYDAVIEHEFIGYTLDDGKKLRIIFSAGDVTTRAVEGV